MKNIIVVLLSLILFSCNKVNKTPDNVIPHEDMVNIIIRMHIADGMLTINNIRRNLAKTDSSNYYEAIFNSYGYSRKDFDTSVYFYSNNISEYDKIYEEILNKLSEMETELKEENSKEGKEKTDNKKKSEKLNEQK